MYKYNRFLLSEVLPGYFSQSSKDQETIASMEALRRVDCLPSPVYTAEELIKSGILMSNAAPHENNPGEWNIKLYMTADASTPKGAALLTLLRDLGVWFEDEVS